VDGSAVHAVMVGSKMIRLVSGADGDHCVGGKTRRPTARKDVEWR
jgi:hypothetical protein